MPLPSQTPELAMLDLLVTVATTGSLGRAAAVHGISQPAASLRLRSLERRLGLPLLVRGPTGSRLTPAGETVVGWAQRVLATADELVRGAEALRAEQVDRVTVAASLTIADELFPRWLTALHRQREAAVVSLRVANSAGVADLVHAGAVEVGFVEGPHAPAGLRTRKVGGDELVVVAAPTHRWLRRRRPVTPEELAAEPLAVREPGSGTREAFELAMAAHGLHIRPWLELGSSAALKSTAEAGEAPAVLSRLTVASELRDRQLVAVAVSGLDLRRTFRAVWAPDRPPSGSAAALVTVAVRASS